MSDERPPGERTERRAAGCGKVRQGGMEPPSLPRWQQWWQQGRRRGGGEELNPSSSILVPFPALLFRGRLNKGQAPSELLSITDVFRAGLKSQRSGKGGKKSKGASQERETVMARGLGVAFVLIGRLELPLSSVVPHDALSDAGLCSPRGPCGGRRKYWLSDSQHGGREAAALF